MNRAIVEPDIVDVVDRFPSELRAAFLNSLIGKHELSIGEMIEINRRLEIYGVGATLERGGSDERA